MFDCFLGFIFAGKLVLLSLPPFYRSGNQGSVRQKNAELGLEPLGSCLKPCATVFYITDGPLGLREVG